MRFNLLCTLALSLSMMISASAQSSARVSGEVSADGEGIPFATVILYVASDTTMAKANTTDDAGRYVLEGIGAGTYFLEVTYVGYQKYSTGVFSLSDEESRAMEAITLLTATQQLDEVVVVTSRPIVEVHPDKTVFNVEGSINASGNTALELLRMSPGVVVDNNDNLILAGKSGVVVYIDGKPSPLSAEDLANYLKSMQSSEIDAIEIITNPSAKYEAEGNAGIINIRLLKDRSLGANGSLTLGYRYGLRSRYNANGNFNYRNKRVNVFGGYGLYDGEDAGSLYLNRQLNGVEYNQVNQQIQKQVSHNFRLGSDFFISRKSTVGFLIDGNLSDSEDHGRSETDIGPIGMSPESILSAENLVNGERNNWNFNLNYTFRGDDESTWNVDADHGMYRNVADSYQPNVYSDYLTGEMTTERVFATDQNTDIDINTFKIDHERKLLGGTVGVGAKLSFVRTNNAYDFYDLVDGDPVLNLDRSNKFVFKENINAGYASYQRALSDKWNLMLGLRVEHTHSTGTLTSMKPSGNDEVDRNYVDFFPSGGLTYQLSEKHSLRANYSRRIDRPSYQDLNPFEYKLDELAFMKGNAFLNPEYSNSVSLTHTFNSRLNTTLSYTRTDDVFTRITEALDDSISILTFVNLAKQTNLALTVSYPFQVTKWWSVYSNMTAYRIHNQATLDGNVINLEAHVLNFYAQNTFILPHGLKLEISGWYNSPSLWEGNWTNEAMGSVDAGIQKTLFHEAANLKISVSDIFRTQDWFGESEYGALKMRANGYWESRQIRINFTYNFGNTQVKGSRDRQTGMEDEQGRIQ